MLKDRSVWRSEGGPRCRYCADDRRWKTCATEAEKGVLSIVVDMQYTDVHLSPLQPKDVEVKYDMQILADRIEFCWIHLNGIGTLENSLWGYDGQSIRVWLNALAIESSAQADEGEIEDVKESVNIPLDFYPLCE